jgi:hypothetical protein
MARARMSLSRGIASSATRTKTHSAVSCPVLFGQPEQAFLALGGVCTA